jgi:hypothetical protein
VQPKRNAIQPLQRALLLSTPQNLQRRFNKGTSLPIYKRLNSLLANFVHRTAETFAVLAESHLALQPQRQSLCSSMQYNIHVNTKLCNFGYAYRLQREKEERKAVALERSKARQAEASYFQAKLQANEQKVKVAAISDSSTERTAASSTVDTSEEPLFSKVNPKGYKVFSR